MITSGAAKNIRINKKNIVYLDGDVDGGRATVGDER